MDRPKDFDKWWPCACVRRNRKGQITGIKMHPPKTLTCRVCGCSQRPSHKPNNGVTGAGGVPFSLWLGIPNRKVVNGECQRAVQEDV
jgi:hypothetical protein